ncbi:MAG: superoxide dismutase family protein [Planctomycetes bacterium]|nr:superoxide dismutase family protein [Planctomycetota bacterium]
MSGTVTFADSGDTILVEAHITGLAPGAHGFHIHQFGDLSSTDGESAGGHYNPDRHDHSGPTSSRRHASDLGNLVADANGVADYTREDRELTLRGSHSIVGRAVIIHAGEDDLRSQPTGMPALASGTA